MALLDAGVPLLAPVAGVSVGLISREKEGGELEHALLADILGLEDHYGDMDFKVAGSRKGVTAIQLDVKLEGGVPLDILEDALEVALTARCSILDNMEAELVKNIPDSKGNNFAGGFDAFMQRGLTIKSHAPRLRVVTFARDRLQFLLGPGGETKRMIEREHDCMLDLGDDAHEVGPSGTSTGCVVHVFAPDKASCEAATRMVQELVCDVEDGAILSAVVQEVKDYGAFVEVLRGRTGLLHVSEISNVVSGMGAVELLKAGDCLDVMCIGSDPLSGAVKLSRKRILDKNDRPKESAFSKIGSQSGSRPDTRPPRRSSTSDTSR
jgi:polyribonucleotide nucleotidyltransferase